MTITTSCMKEKTSNDVYITIYNECRAQIKIYDITESRQYLSDMYDCSYVSFLPILLKPGKYKIIAETFEGKRPKGYSQNPTFQEMLPSSFLKGKTFCRK